MSSNIDKIIPGESKSIKSPRSCKDIQRKFLIYNIHNSTLLQKKTANKYNKSPMPIKANEKVSKKDNPNIKVLILEEIFWTISEELDGLCIEKYIAILLLNK